MATKARRKTNQGQTKAKHTPVVLPEVKQWMYATYAVGEGELDRSEMHTRYKAFCESRGITPKDPAYFGKIVRHLFPNCGYRRLGGRKEGSVSHYSGIVLRRGDPARAVKSQRKVKMASRRVQTEEADKLHFVIEEPQQLTSKKRGKREEEEDEEEEEEEENEDERESKADRRVESGALMRTSKSPQRGKRTQLVVHRSFTFGPTHRQASLDMMSIIRTYRNVYRHELWGLTPTNPASMKSTLINYILYEEEGLKERSSLSFSCLTMLCIASFLQGDWGFSRSFFHLAREHLQSINELDFDVAAALVVYGWWATFYAHTAEDGKRTQLGYAKTGRKICERLGAYNDEVYWLLLNLESVNRTEQNLEIIEEVKGKYPPYKRPWKVFKNLKRPASSEWAQSFRTLNAMFQYVLTSVSVMKSPLENEEKKERRNTLLTQLNTSLILERELLGTNNRPCAQTFNMLMTFNYALRALIYSLLGSTKAVNAAEDLFKFLLLVPAPMMLISMHGLVVAEYVLIRTVTDVLVGSGHHQLLRKMLKRIDDSKINDGFYWLTYVCTYIEAKLDAPYLPPAAAPLQLGLVPKAAGSTKLQSPKAPPAISPSQNPPPSAYASSFTSPPTTATPGYPPPPRHLTEPPRPTPPPTAIWADEREYQLAHADLRRQPYDQASTMVAPYLPPIPASSYGSRPQPSHPLLRPSYPLPPQSPYQPQPSYPPQSSYPPPPTALFPQHAPPREPSWTTLRPPGFDDGATFNSPPTQLPQQDMYAAPPGYYEAPGMSLGYSRHMQAHPSVQTSQQWSSSSSEVPGMPSEGRSQPLRATHLYHDAPRHQLSSPAHPIPSSRSSPANAMPPLRHTPSLFHDDVYQQHHHHQQQQHFEIERYRAEHQQHPDHHQGQQYHHAGSTREWSAHVVSSEDDYDHNSSPPALRRAAVAGQTTLSSSPPGLSDALSLDALRGRVLHSGPPQPQRFSPRHHYPPAGGHHPHDPISFFAPPREPSWGTLRLPGLADDSVNSVSDEGDQLDRNVSALFSMLERSRHDPHFAPSGPPPGGRPA